MVAESWKEPTHWYQTNLLSQVAFHDYLRKKKVFKKICSHFNSRSIWRYKWLDKGKS